MQVPRGFDERLRGALVHARVLGHARCGADVGPGGFLPVPSPRFVLSLFQVSIREQRRGLPRGRLVRGNELGTLWIERERDPVGIGRGSRIILREGGLGGVDIPVRVRALDAGDFGVSSPPELLHRRL